MKIVIDIPDGCYEELNSGRFPAQDAYRLVAWIKNGMPIPENATNGDVIKAVFPSVEVIEIYEGIVNISLDTWTPFSEEWWNSPYKEGDKE